MRYFTLPPIRVLEETEELLACRCMSDPKRVESYKCCMQDSLDLLDVAMICLVTAD